ncbi:MAG TPA: hypothetical protein ENI23_08810 [bacterium]|nr:hypothetical protein [bacterium]
MSEDLKIQPALALPRNVINSIQPVYNVNPERIVNIVRSQNRATTGISIIFATPTVRKFFLTGAWLSYNHNVTADSVGVTISITIDGVQQFILASEKLSLTAVKEHMEISFPFPILIDKGTNILIAQTFSVGAGNIRAGIIGYTTDPQ